MLNNPMIPPKVTATSIVPSGSSEDLKRKERYEKIEQLKRQLNAPIQKDRAKRGSVQVCLTHTNMKSEVEEFRRKQLELARGNIQKAPAKQDPNSSLRRLSITSQNLQSYNQLFALGGIRKDQRERTINFTTEQEDSLAQGQKKNPKMGDFASSTITDLR